MEAIVLAGGFGTRLSHVVSDVPKPMAPINYKPFLQYLLDYGISNGINRFILAVGYKSHIIKSYFNDNYKGAEILYSDEDKPLFTGGAIKKAMSLCNDPYFIILNGDTYFDVDLKDMFNYHINNNNHITIATKAMKNFDRYGTVLCDNNRIIEFKEKTPTEQGDINGGVYICNKSVLSDFDEEKFSFEQQILEKKLKELRISAFPSEGYFIDIGVPEDYYKAQKDFEGK